METFSQSKSLIQLLQKIRNEARMHTNSPALAGNDPVQLHSFTVGQCLPPLHLRGSVVKLDQFLRWKERHGAKADASCSCTKHYI